MVKLWYGELLNYIHYPEVTALTSWDLQIHYSMWTVIKIMMKGEIWSFGEVTVETA